MKESPRRRLLVVQRIPDQSVFAFNRNIYDLIKKLIKCPQSKEIRHLISHFERENSIIDKPTAIDSVIEPQK